MHGNLWAGLLVAQRLAAFALQQLDHMQAIAAFQRCFQQARFAPQQALFELRDGLPGLNPAQFAAVVAGRAVGEAHGFLRKAFGMLPQFGDQRLGGFPQLCTAVQIVGGAGQQDMAQTHPPGADEARRVGLEPGPAACFVRLRNDDFALQQLTDQRLFLGLALFAKGNQAQRLGALQQQLPHDQCAACGGQSGVVAGGRVVLQFAGEHVFGDLHTIHLQVRQFDLFHAFAVVGAAHDFTSCLVPALSRGRGRDKDLKPCGVSAGRSGSCGPGTTPGR
ncbi:hypothetical protein D3C80_1086130 [compost metagenome]